MKIIIGESQSNDIIEKLLKKLNVEFNLIYWNDNGFDSITGTVYLYKDGNIFGYKHGYEFFYKYDRIGKYLTYDGHFPKIENLDFFGAIPPDMVINFFSDKMKTYLENFISKGYSGIRK